MDQLYIAMQNGPQSLALDLVLLGSTLWESIEIWSLLSPRLISLVHEARFVIVSNCRLFQTQLKLSSSFFGIRHNVRNANDRGK